jgi:ATP-dependent DNA helicase RecG
MERRGSGLRKICHETMAKDNYEDKYLPRFENSNGFFRVTLWDMNYVKGSPTDQVTDQVTALLSALGGKELSAIELMDALSLSHRPTFRANYLNPALEAGLIERTIPDKPNSRLQKYRRTR